MITRLPSRYTVGLRIPRRTSAAKLLIHFITIIMHQPSTTTINDH